MAREKLIKPDATALEILAKSQQLRLGMGISPMTVFGAGITI
jgi:hypothetical protein